MSRAVTCTYHCSACGCHFHSLEAFDAQRLGDFATNDPETGRRCVHPFELDNRLAALAENGECRTYADLKRGVTVWTTTRQAGTRHWETPQRVHVEPTADRWTTTTTASKGGTDD